MKTKFTFILFLAACSLSYCQRDVQEELIRKLDVVVLDQYTDWSVPYDSTIRDYIILKTKYNSAGKALEKFVYSPFKLKVKYAYLYESDTLLVKSITHNRDSTTILSISDHAYDDQGRLETITHRTSGKTTLTTRYKYDDKNRRIELSSFYKNESKNSFLEYLEPLERWASIVQQNRKHKYTFGYNAQGLLQDVNSNDLMRNFEIIYDSLGRKKEVYGISSTNEKVLLLKVESYNANDKPSRETIYFHHTYKLLTVNGMGRFNAGDNLTKEVYYHANGLIDYIVEHKNGELYGTQNYKYTYRGE